MVTPRAEISEAPNSVDLECGKRKLRRPHEEPSVKATGRETVETKSLVNDSCLDEPGQLLDEALAKQIAVREAELDSLAKNTLQVNNNDSVFASSSVQHQGPKIFDPLIKGVSEFLNNIQSFSTTRSKSTLRSQRWI